MNEQSIIAHVDETTQGALEKVTEEIASAIADSLEPLAEPMEEMQNSMQEISEKLQGFSAVASSIESLRAMAEESGRLGKELLPLQEEMAAIQKNQGSHMESLSTALSALENRQEARATCLAASFESAAQVQAKAIAALEAEIASTREQAIQKMGQIGRAQQMGMDHLKTVASENAEHLQNRLSVLEERLARQDERLVSLEESAEKTLLTLDIIVKLVTPFWKKIGK